MKKFVCGFHRNELGLGLIATILVLLLVAGSGAGAFWWLSSKLGPEDGTTLPDMPYRQEDARTWGCWGSGHTLYTRIKWAGAMFIDPFYLGAPAADAVIVTHWTVRWSRRTDGNRVYEVRAYKDGGLMGVVHTYAHNDLPSQGDSVTPTLVSEYTFEFDTPFLMEPGHSYRLAGVVTSGSTGTYWSQYENISPADGRCCSAWVRTAEGATRGYNGKLQGFTSIVTGITTVGHEWQDDGSALLRGWAQVLSTMECGFLIGDELDVDAGEGVYYKAGDASAGDTRYHFEQRVTGFADAVEYFYRAKGTIKGTGDVVLGDVKSMTRNATLEWPYLDCVVDRNCIEGLHFKTTIADIKAEQSFNISVCYGTSAEAAHACNQSVEVATGVTEDSTFRTTGLGFEPGTRYWYRARAEDNGLVAYSETKSFIRWDASQPGWSQRTVNWIRDKLGLEFTADWLWILLVLLLLMPFWLLAARHRAWVVAIIPTFIGLALLISFGVLTAWIVVLMAILAGWIIFKVVFKHSGSTGS